MKLLAVLAALTVSVMVVTGCGLASSASTTLPGKPQKLSPGQTTGQIVLTSGDVAAYEQQEQDSETLKQQYPRKGWAHRAAAIALIKRTWLASRHTVLLDQSNNYRVLSDANLFKTAKAAKKIWKLEKPKKGLLRVPAGAPPHAVLVLQNAGGDLEYWMGWQRDRVISFVAVSTASGTSFPTPDLAIQSLTLAAKAQDAKVRGALLVASPNA